MQLNQIGRAIAAKHGGVSSFPDDFYGYFGGESWDCDYILRADGPNSDLGYPSTVELDDFGFPHLAPIEQESGMSAIEYTPLTQREKVLFDLKGFILFPAVLSAEEIAPIKEQCEALRQDPESLPPAGRKLPGGAAEVLIDHPAVMRVLHEIIDDETEKIRCENCFLSYRYREVDDKGEFILFNRRIVGAEVRTTGKTASLVGTRLS